MEKEGILFSGDTLFCRSLGRTDLETGSTDMIVDSILNKLLVLPDEVVVYPGHNNKTTIGEEKKYNPVALGYRG
jgi:glyoxylase-like metal-dependent hydrolase (beta-lactamase superfamily II)